MDKIKKLISEHKVFFSIFFVAVALLCIEYITVNTYVDKKTSNNSNKDSNKLISINDLSEKKKRVVGISSNSNSNTNIGESTVTTEKIVDKKNEEKKKELSDSNLNPNYDNYNKKTDKEKEKIDYIPSEEIVSNDELKKIDDNKPINLPSKFDLNNVITLNYQNQGSYGLCWDFAATKVYETYLALNYNKNYDFSEIAVDYLSSGLVYGYHNLHNGGQFKIYDKVVKKLGGLIESKNITGNYNHKYSETEYLNFFNLPRVSIENYEVVQFPTYYIDGTLKSAGNKDVTEEDLEEYRRLMKKHIMTNSALYFGINSNSHAIDRSAKESENPQGEYSDIPMDRVFYCNLSDCFNNSEPHAMAIIGWDDNFDRRAFRQEDSNGNVYYPKKNGAFIVANSWSDHKDYYYVSYEHSELYQEVVGIKKVDTTDLSKYLNITNFSDKAKDIFNENDIVYINGQKYISYSKLDNITYLFLNDKGFTSEDLKILKYFKNLDYLELNNNNITDLSFLSNLTKLEVLNLGSNQISDISVLNNLSKLKMLDLSDNMVSDVSVLKNLYELQTVQLDNNVLTNYENTFSNLVDLNVLSLENCGIGNIYLNSNTNFLTINLSRNPDLKIMNKLKVDVLELNSNNYTDLSVLSNINEDSLKSISIGDNDIKDISVLSNYKNLYSINLSGNKNISSFDPVINLFKKDNKSADKLSTSIFLGALNDFNKKYNEDHIDIDGTTNEPGMDYFTYSSNELILDNCNISDISIFNNIDLFKLSLADNSISNVDKFKNDSVFELHLSGNKIKNNDITSLFKGKISELYLANNGITKLSINTIPTNKYMTLLDLSNNDITNISALNKIEFINILSLENNTNLSNINLTKEVLMLNLSNTAVDDTIVDKINIEVTSTLNLSSNKNIKDISEVVRKLDIKAKKIYNEKRDKALNDNGINEESIDYEYYMYEGSYYQLDLILNYYTLNYVPYNQYMLIYSDSVINKPEGSSYIDLISKDNINLFKFIQNKDYNLNNATLSRDETKLYLGNNSSLDYGYLLNSNMRYQIRFN